MIVVKVGPKDLGKYETALGRKLPFVMQKGIMEGGKRAAAHLALLSEQRVSDFTGKFNRGWVAERVPHGVAVRNKAPYAPYVELGRRPGKPPPAGVLEPWVEKVLSVPPPRSKEVAYLVARAIGKHGIRPRPVMTAPGQLTKMVEIVNKALMMRLDKALAESARG